MPFTEKQRSDPGKSKRWSEWCLRRNKDGKPMVVIFDKNGKDESVARFIPTKFTPQQIVKMWEEERKANPKGTNEDIRQAVLKRRDAN